MSKSDFGYSFDWTQSNADGALEQGRAKPNSMARNRNQCVPLGRFRTTKSKPICIAGFFRNQNRNQCLYFEQIRNQNQNQYA